MKKLLHDYEMGKKLAIIRGSDNISIVRLVVCSRGGIAQLGERLHGMQEVIGSIPFTSTTDLSVRKVSCR